MKYLACSFIQYLENKKVSGSEKIIGFTIENNHITLHFAKMPTITEWLMFCDVWYDEFEQVNSLRLKTK